MVWYGTGCNESYSIFTEFVNETDNWTSKALGFQQLCVYVEWGTFTLTI